MAINANFGTISVSTSQSASSTPSIADAPLASSREILLSRRNSTQFLSFAFFPATAVPRLIFASLERIANAVLTSNERKKTDRGEDLRYFDQPLAMPIIFQKMCQF